MKIECIVGSEVLTGSTRMKAGTATKMILNMISTTTMIMLNKVYKNFMVDLKINNQKLLDRGVRIISAVTELNRCESRLLLKKSKGKVKVAILMYLTGKNYKDSKAFLLNKKGSLRQCIE